MNPFELEDILHDFLNSIGNNEEDFFELCMSELEERPDIFDIKDESLVKERIKEILSEEELL